MQVIEHQYLHYQKVLACRVQLDAGCVADFLQRLPEKLYNLKLKSKGTGIVS